MKKKHYPGIFIYERIFKRYQDLISDCLLSWQQSFPFIRGGGIELDLQKNKDQILDLRKKIRVDLCWLNQRLFRTNDHMALVMVQVATNYVTLLMAINEILVKLCKLIELENNDIPQRSAINLYSLCRSLNAVIPKLIEKPARVLYFPAESLKKHQRYPMKLFDKALHLLERAVGHHHSIPSENDARHKANNAIKCSNQ